MTSSSKIEPIGHTTQQSITQAIPLNWLSDSLELQESFLFSFHRRRPTSSLYIQLQFTTNTNLSASEPGWVLGKRGNNFKS